MQKIEAGTPATMEEFYDLIPVVIASVTEVDGVITSITVEEDHDIPSRTPKDRHTLEFDLETQKYGDEYRSLFMLGEQHTFLVEDELK